MKNRLPDLNVPARERIGWVDLLRVIACFLVVFSHSCDAFVAVFDSDRATFLQGALAGSFVRACVPLFVMMSGVLLLPVRTGTGAFYRKRIGRVLLALVFWSLTLPVLYYLYMRYVGTSSPSIDPALFTGEATLHKMWTFVFNFCYDTTPLWYLYMLIGLYLIMPLISPWLERASRRELQSVLAIWGVTLLLPFTYGMDPAAGISMLLAISFGAIYGGSITAILIGTPGTPASAATIPLLQIPEILSPREASAPGRKPLQYRKVRRTIAANGNQKRKHGHDFGIGKESAALLDPAVP